MPLTHSPVKPDEQIAIDAGRFDGLAKLYTAAQEKADLAAEDAKQKKAEVLEFVQQHGFVPKGAEASRRVEGWVYVATLTTGTTVEINDATVTELELTLSRAKRSEVFPTLFSRRTEFSLVKGAETIIKTAKLPARWAARIKELYSQSFTVRTKAPTLKVEPLAVFQEREAKAAKKAKKPTKK